MKKIGPAWTRSVEGQARRAANHHVSPRKARPPERMAARQEIVDAAQTYRVRRSVRGIKAGIGYLPHVLTMRHVQRCVSICRAHGLVGDAVLVRAGYSPARTMQG